MIKDLLEYWKLKKEHRKVLRSKEIIANDNRNLIAENRKLKKEIQEIKKGIKK